MDPYLENPLRWQSVHGQLIMFLNHALNAILPPEFRSYFEERVYVLGQQQGFRPDLAVNRSLSSGLSTGGIAVLDRPQTLSADEPRHLRLLEVPIKERYLLIVSRAEPARVVTTIELVSPANKSTTKGRAEYLAEQQLILDSETNLLEIDLLRAGSYILAAPEDLLRQECAAWDYLICLHRAKQNADFEYWPVQLPERLPRIRIPLLEGYADVVLDLQAVLDQTYAFAGWERDLHYDAEPEPPLAPHYQSWADNLLRQTVH